MRFGPVAPREAAGALLAHSLRLAGGTLRKGTRLSADDTAALEAEGVRAVTVARLEPGDLTENEAALAVARAMAGSGVRVSSPFTGRANLLAGTRGLVDLDPGRILAVNGVDEGITLATLSDGALVEPRQLVATVKIIPLAVPEAAVAAAGAAAGEPGPVRVAALRPRACALVQTRLPGTRERLLDKAREATRERLGALGASLVEERRVAHDVAEVAGALAELAGSGAELLLLVGASAIVDRRDVVPAAVEAAGGRVERLGMPVDPGNLSLVADVGGVPLLAMPGSARSVRPSGCDDLLRRLLAGLPVTRETIAVMGVGGLRKEMAGRPQPRQEVVGTPPRGGPRIAALVLAAGQSRRMGPINKLLVEVAGESMVRRAARAALDAGADPVLVVTGHEGDRVAAALEGLGVELVHNPRFAEGLSASLSVGIGALPVGIDGVAVCLGDMPGVEGAHLARLMEAFDPAAGRAVCVPTFRGKRGNPVLWAERFFAEMREIRGDVGARHLIGEHEDSVHEVAIADAAVVRDVDTPEALSRL